jgi:hypothetical protein
MDLQYSLKDNTLIINYSAQDEERSYYKFFGEGWETEDWIEYTGSFNIKELTRA